MEISGGELITGGNLTAAGVIVWQLVRLIGRITTFIEEGGKHRVVVESQLKAIADNDDVVKQLKLIVTGLKAWGGTPRVVVREASGPIAVSDPSGEHPTQ